MRFRLEAAPCTAPPSSPPSSAELPSWPPIWPPGVSSGQASECSLEGPTCASHACQGKQGTKCLGWCRPQAGHCFPHCGLGFFLQLNDRSEAPGLINSVFWAGGVRGTWYTDR